jgi:membrane protein insertase Oxa1/YidC/SpoIIIJ
MVRVGWVRYFVVALSGGLLFGILDALLNANPLAQAVFAAYAPIAKTSVNIMAGITIDLIYGFVLAGLFLILYRSLPGQGGLAKGLSFGLMVWFMRVLMSVASSWMMFNLPNSLLLYVLFTGLFELLVLGLYFALTLRSGSVRE